MSDNKKYYYLKLKDNFFDRKEIKIIKAMPQGDTYICIMLHMFLLSLERHGRLMIANDIPYDLSTLSVVLGREEGMVKRAVEIFNKFGLVETMREGEIYMMDIQNFIGKSSTEADRIREFRLEVDERKLIENTTSCTKVQQKYNIRTPKKEIEKELKIKKEEKDCKKFSSFILNQIDTYWIPRSKQHFKTVKIDRYSFADDLDKMIRIEKQSEQNILKIQEYISQPTLTTGKDFAKKEIDVFWFDKIRLPSSLRKRSKAGSMYYEHVLEEINKLDVDKNKDYF